MQNYNNIEMDGLYDDFAEDTPSRSKTSASGTSSAAGGGDGTGRDGTTGSSSAELVAAKERIRILERNMSGIFVTARLEMARKDQQIARLQELLATERDGKNLQQAALHVYAGWLREAAANLQQQATAAGVSGSGSAFDTTVAEIVRLAGIPLGSAASSDGSPADAASTPSSLVGMTELHALVKAAELVGRSTAPTTAAAQVMGVTAAPLPTTGSVGAGIPAGAAPVELPSAASTSASATQQGSGVGGTAAAPSGYSFHQHGQQRQHHHSRDSSSYSQQQQQQQHYGASRQQQQHYISQQQSGGSAGYGGSYGTGSGGGHYGGSGGPGRYAGPGGAAGYQQASYAPYPSSSSSSSAAPHAPPLLQQQGGAAGWGYYPPQGGQGGGAGGGYYGGRGGGGR